MTTMLIAQITDMHVRGGGAPAFDGKVDTTRRLADTVAFINSLAAQPDLVLATGDLVDTGDAADYDTLAQVLKPLRAPLLLIPGNHDARGPLRDAFPDIARRAGDGFVHYVAEDHPVRLVALDTLEDGRIGGLLCERRLAWIEQTLARSDRPTILFMHHPPFDFGATANDNMRCAGAERLGAIVARHRSIEAILCGHLHRSTMRRWHGTVALTIPATAPLLELQVSGAGPRGWIDAPPSVGLHLWRADAGLISHTVAINEPLDLVRFDRAK